MKQVEHNDQLGMSTLGFIFANIAHVRRFMLQPETEYQALYDNFASPFGLVWSRAVVEDFAPRYYRACNALYSTAVHTTVHATTPTSSTVLYYGDGGNFNNAVGVLS